MVRVLFIPAAVAEGGILRRGLFIAIVLRVNTWYSLYTMRNSGLAQC